MNVGVLRVVRWVASGALVVCGLGWLVVSVSHVDQAVRFPAAGFPGQWFRTGLLTTLLQATIPALLSGLLLVACEIALHLNRTQHPEDEA